MHSIYYKSGAYKVMEFTRKTGINLAVRSSYRHPRKYL